MSTSHRKCIEYYISKVGGTGLDRAFYRPFNEKSIEKKNTFLLHFQSNIILPICMCIDLQFFTYSWTWLTSFKFACYKLKVKWETLLVILQSGIENLDISRTKSAEYVFIRKRREHSNWLLVRTFVWRSRAKNFHRFPKKFQ